VSECGVHWEWLAAQSRPYTCRLRAGHDGPHIDRWVMWEQPRGLRRLAPKWLRKPPRVLSIREMDELRASLDDPHWGRR
jgi:hypothetical protein